MEQPRAAWVKLSGVAMKEWHGRPARDHAQDARAIFKLHQYRPVESPSLCVDSVISESPC